MREYREQIFACPPFQATIETEIAQALGEANE
jgi:hypothetical protein